MQERKHIEKQNQQCSSIKIDCDLKQTYGKMVRNNHLYSTFTLKIGTKTIHSLSYDT